MIAFYKNGKVALKSDDGMELVVCSPKYRRGGDGSVSPEVHLWDEENRYAAIFFEGVMLGREPTAEIKVEVLNKVLKDYLTYRGTRTSWTLKDSWFKKWDKKRNGLSAVSVR